MELLKSAILFATGIFILMVIIAFIVLVTCFIKMLFLGLSELNKIDKEDPEPEMVVNKDDSTYVPMRDTSEPIIRG